LLLLLLSPLKELLLLLHLHLMGQGHCGHRVKLLLFYPGDPPLLLPLTSPRISLALAALLVCGALAALGMRTQRSGHSISLSLRGTSSVYPEVYMQHQYILKLIYYMQYL
jgi:hypothetical protein